MSRAAPDPELVRRALERRRAGEAYAAIAADCGVSEGAVRAWVRRFGDIAASPPPPPILRDPPPRPADTPSDLAADLERVAVALDAAGGVDFAVIVRRGRDALTALEAPVDDAAPSPGEDQRGWIVAMLARTQASYERAEASHNARAATQYASALERWARLLRQHDAVHVDDDVIVIPRAELETRLAGLRETMAALTANGPTCRVCGERIRAGWADEVVAERAAAPAPEQA